MEIFVGSPAEQFDMPRQIEKPINPYREERSNEMFIIENDLPPYPSTIEDRTGNPDSDPSFLQKMESPHFQGAKKNSHLQINVKIDSEVHREDRLRLKEEIKSQRVESSIEPMPSLVGLPTQYLS